jgi:hypothetical protein
MSVAIPLHSLAVSHIKPPASFLRPLVLVGLRLGLTGTAWALERSVRKSARSMADQAVWFRGAADHVKQADPMADAVDPNGTLSASLERYEKALMSTREALLGTMALHSAKNGKHSQRLAAVAATCAAAYADAFEAVQAFRWALMEQAADADIAAGRVHTFDSAEALLAQLQA